MSSKAEKILEEFQHLTPTEQRWVRRKIAEVPTAEATGDGLKYFLSLAGTLESDFDDVSTNKGKHLAEVYADKRE